MGIHTSIYRERYISWTDVDKYQIKLFKGAGEVKLENAVSIREEFYFGKSTWAINEWFLKWAMKEYDDDEDLSYEYVYDKYIYLDDLKKLLKDVKKVLKDPTLAEKVLPMPKDLKLVRPRKETLDAVKNIYVAGDEDDWEDVPRNEMYNEYYFETLKRAEEIIEQLIREDGGDLISDYILQIV